MMDKPKSGRSGCIPTGNEKNQTGRVGDPHCGGDGGVLTLTDYFEVV